MSSSVDVEHLSVLCCTEVDNKKLLILTLIDSSISLATTLGRGNSLLTFILLDMGIS